MRILPVLALTALFTIFVPSANAATLDITAEEPEGPLAWDAATVLVVTATASCAEVIQESQAGPSEFTFALGEGSPPWIKETGTPVAFSEDACDSSTASGAAGCSPAPACAASYPRATFTAELSLLPTEDAPGLAPVTLVIVADGQEGQAEVPVTVAYRGTLEAPLPEQSLTTGADGNASFVLSLRVATNSLSMLMLEVTESPQHGTVDEIPLTIDITPPDSSAMVGMPMTPNRMEQDIDIPLVFHGPATAWASDNLTVRAQLMAYADDRLTAAPVTLRFAFAPGAPARVQSEGDAPGPDVGLLVLVSIGALLWARRARRA